MGKPVGSVCLPTWVITAKDSIPPALREARRFFYAVGEEAHNYMADSYFLKEMKLKGHCGCLNINVLFKENTGFRESGRSNSKNNENKEFKEFLDFAAKTGGVFQNFRRYPFRV